MSGKSESINTSGERESTINQLIDKAKKIDDKELPILQSRLASMINYAIGRLDYYEEYRRRYLQIGLATIALSITLLTLVGANYLPEISTLLKNLKELSVWRSSFPYIAVLIIAADLAWVGFHQLWLYISYTSPEYPYREITSPDWFYRYVASKKDQKELLKTKFGKNDKKAIELQKMYLDDLQAYGTRLMNRSPQDSVVNDIEQLMALHTLTQYKQAHTSTMREKLWLDLRILICIAIIASIAIIANHAL